MERSLTVNQVRNGYLVRFQGHPRITSHHIPTQPFSHAGSRERRRLYVECKFEDQRTDNGAGLLASSDGYGFVCSLGDMMATKRAGKQFVSVDAGGKLLAPVLFLTAGVLPVNSYAAPFFLRFLPFMVVNQILFVVASRGLPTWRGQQYTLALFPVWIKACVTAAANVYAGVPLDFAVTPKTGTHADRLHLHARRDAGDAFAVALLRHDRAGHVGAVPRAVARAAAGEVARGRLAGSDPVARVAGIGVAVVFHEGSTLLVVANALRLLAFKDLAKPND